MAGLHISIKFQGTKSIINCQSVGWDGPVAACSILLKAICL